MAFVWLSLVRPGELMLLRRGKDGTLILNYFSDVMEHLHLLQDG